MITKMFTFAIANHLNNSVILNKMTNLEFIQLKISGAPSYGGLARYH